MEAAAAGTPVIASPMARWVRSSSTTHGVPRQLVQELTTAITRAHEIEPETCRAVAHARFSEASMVERYIELYGRLTA